MNESPNPHISKTWLTRAEPSGEKIQQELNTLRQSNRLAVHMNEDNVFLKGEKNPHVFNPTTWDWFRTAPQDIRKYLRDPEVNKQRNLPLISMSLLPSGSKSIMTFVGDYTTSAISGYGYLVDLNQFQANAPVVVGAFPRSMNSEDDVYRKKFWVKTEKFWPAAQKMGYQKWIEKCSESPPLAQEAPTKEPANLVEKLLDKLASHYTSSSQALFELNEIIVAASKEHIRAIVITTSRAYQSENDPLNLMSARLAGALLGLQHLKQKPPINLPVVLYHTRENHGDITYVGQGKQALNAVALDAIAAIQEKATPDTHKQFKQLQAVATIELGIDLFKPLSEQNAQVQKLRGTHSAAASLAK